MDSIKSENMNLYTPLGNICGDKEIGEEAVTQQAVQKVFQKMQEYPEFRHLLNKYVNASTVLDKREVIIQIASFVLDKTGANTQKAELRHLLNKYVNVCTVLGKMEVSTQIASMLLDEMRASTQKAELRHLLNKYVNACTVLGKMEVSTQIASMLLDEMRASTQEV